MKGFISFFTIVLSIYILTNTYIYFRAKQALALVGWHLWTYRLVFFLLVLSFPLGRIIRSQCECQIERVLVNIGSWWGGAMFYLFIVILLIDIVRALFFVSGYQPEILKLTEYSKRIFALSIGFLVLCTLIYGFFNARNTKIKKVIIDRDNRLAKLDMKAAMISDVHLGIMIDNDRLRKIVDRVNSLKPDIIFIVGDIFDENVERLDDMEKTLRSLSSKYGVYAVTGNHEFYAGVGKAVEFMKDAGIKVLRDEYIEIDNRLTIVGVDDPTSGRFGETPKPLKEILKENNKTYPVILLSHQPRNIEDAAKNGTDLMVSGHVHGGQVWPVRFITNSIFKLEERIFKNGRMQVVISDGVGTWGPPFRIGTQSEIVEILMKK